MSGGEFNVSANLSDCFRLKTGLASAMVDYPIGDLIAERVRAMGVTPFYKHFKHDGVRGPNMATVYSDRGQGVRAPVVFYNRCNEAAGQIKPGDFNWEEIFGAGVRWFHSGGIFAALSETTGELIVEAMKAAKAAGAVTSFDLNYRQKLWDIWGGHVEGAQVCSATSCSTSRRARWQRGGSCRKASASRGRDVESKGEARPVACSTRVIEKAVKKFPKVKVVATTLREVHSTSRHTWGAVAWIDGKTYQSPMAELDVIDRVGGGDGYAAGFIYGLLSGASEEEAVKLGWAHGALLTTRSPVTPRWRRWSRCGRSR